MTSANPSPKRIELFGCFISVVIATAISACLLAIAGWYAFQFLLAVSFFAADRAQLFQIATIVLIVGGASLLWLALSLLIYKNVTGKWPDLKPTPRPVRSPDEEAKALRWRKQVWRVLSVIGALLVAAVVLFVVYRRNPRLVVDLAFGITRPAATLPPTLAVGQTPGPGSVIISEVDGMRMVYVPADEFLMGSSDSDSQASSSEKPQHTVYLDVYWIDRTEVANAMYAKCVSAGACQLPSDTSSYTRDSYYDNWLRRLSGDQRFVERRNGVLRLGRPPLAHRSRMGEGGERYGWQDLSVGGHIAQFGSAELQ